MCHIIITITLYKHLITISISLTLASQIVNFIGTIVLYLLPVCGLQLWPWPWIFKVKFWKKSVIGMGGRIDSEKMGFESIGCWTHVVTLNFDLTDDLDLRFSRWNIEIAVSQEWEAGVDSLGIKGMWVGYDIGCIMGLTLGDGAWQIDRPSDGSMWNSYRFQPVGPEWAIRIRSLI